MLHIVALTTLCPKTIRTHPNMQHDINQVPHTDQSEHSFCSDRNIYFYIECHFT